MPRPLTPTLSPIKSDGGDGPRSSHQTISKFAAAFALLLALLSTPAHALKVEDIKSPRPTGWVTDTANLLDDAAEAELNNLGDAVHARDNAELAIVTVKSTEGADHRTFATALANHWGIGDATLDNGILIFVAIDDRAAELILGDGLDSDAQVAISDRIMQSHMVPAFRNSDPQGAIMIGAQLAARELLGLAPTDDAANLTGTESPIAGAPYPSVATPEPYGSGGFENVSSEDRDNTLPHWFPELAGGAGGLGLLGLGVRRWMRYRPRKCDRCNAPMTRLEETSDDIHLSPAELKEEQVKSVDYDIWACRSCSNVQKIRYGALFTSYAKCPKCAAVTKSSAETTLVAATYDHGGRVRVDEKCEFCGYANSFERSTPKRTRSSSSSSRSGFSGGSSSGRGSSGRW